MRIAATFLLVSLFFQAQAQTINGPSSATVGQTVNYTLNNGTIYSNQLWQIVGGTKVSQTLSGTLYTVTVTWTTSGTGRVTFLSNYNPITYKDVTVTGCASPATPTGSLNASSGSCGPKTLTYTGTPPSGVTWYWQTSPSGVSTSYSSSYSATTSGTYYLRAKANCGSNWSSGYLSINVTINPYPSAPSLPIVSGNTCGNKTLTKGIPPAGTQWYWQGTSSSSSSTSNTNQNYEVGASGTYYIRALTTATGCWSTTSTGISVTVTSPGAPYCDPNALNWTQSVAFSSDASGNPIQVASQIVYADGTGAGMQSQSKSYTSNAVLAAQSIRNKYGMPAIATLPAPINSSSFSYKYNFVTNQQGYAYNWEDFDKRQSTGASGEVSNPVPVSNGGAGTLGWYYSTSNNLEPATPVTGFPYARTYAPEGPNPAFSQSAGPGEQHRMGSGHELKTEQVKFNKNELSHYFELRKYFAEPVLYETNLLPNADANTTSGFIANQTVAVSSVTQNGQTYVKAIANQTTSTPGISPIGGTISVTPGASYTFAVKGYKTSTTNPVQLYVRSGTAGATIVWPGATLPSGSGNEGWVKNSFTVPAGVTTITVGVLFNTPITMGDAFYLNAVMLTPDNPVYGYKTITTSPDGKQVVSFTSIEGLTLASATLTGSSLDNWSYSYYNDAGQLLATVAPKGVVAGNVDPPYFTTRYKYDHWGRLIEITSTDEGTTQYVYSTDGKIRFSQNSEQRNAAVKRFSYTNYDKLGRLIESGEYSMSGTGYYVFETLSAAAPVTNSVLNIADNVGYTGVTRKSDPNNRCSDYNYIEYDITASDLPAGDTQNYLYGQISKTENATSRTWYSYDEFCQLVWTKQSIPDLGYKTVQYTFDFLGNVTLVGYQVGQTDKFYHHYVYDADQRLSEVLTSFDGTNTTLRARYYYYLHGPLKRVEYGNQSQGVDYVYTISGALKAINGAEPSRDPGADGISGAHLGFGKDAFGVTLHYYDNDYTGAQYNAGAQTVSGYGNHYGGALKAQTWHSALDGDMPRAFAYTYDDKYQLTDTRFGSVNVASPNTVSFPGNNQYREGIGSYDKNGNIESLTRRDEAGNLTANYTYAYESNTNKLDKVNDNGSALVDYAYNQVGQATQMVEGGVTKNITYTPYGLVKEVRNGSQLVTAYTYSDRGDLLIKTNYTAGTASLKTYYVRDAAGNVLSIYEKIMPSGSVLLKEVPIYGAGRIGTYKKSSNRWFYEIGDQLGNVRALIGDAQVSSYFANMETAANADFRNYARSNFDLVDHTDAGTVYTYAHLRTGGSNSQVGLAKDFEVFTGDKIKIEAYAKYLNLSSSQSNLANFAVALTAAFGVSPASTGLEAQRYAALNSYGSAAAGGNKTVSSEPKAFVNILIFDKDHNFLDAAYQQVDADAEQDGPDKSPHDYLMKEVTITQPGYVYAYVSNENSTLADVYFDDVTITHTQSPIVLSTDYYSFGLPIVARDSVYEPYRFGYQGQFSEKDTINGWNEFELRMYDARIGRWLSVDPYGQFASPYLAMGNVPHTRYDPDGGFSPDPVVKVMGMWRVTEAAHQAAHMAAGATLLNTITVMGAEAIRFKGTGGILGSLGKLTAYQAVSQYVRLSNYIPVELTAIDTSPLTNIKDPKYEMSRQLTEGCSMCPGSSWIDWAGVAVDAGDDLMGQVGQNFRALQAEASSLRAGFDFGREMSKVSATTNTLKWTGRGLALINAYNIETQYRKGQITQSTRALEQGTNIFSTFGGVYGASWGVGWEIGRVITTFNWYQTWKRDTWLPWRNETLGY